MDAAERISKLEQKVRDLDLQHQENDKQYREGFISYVEYQETGHDITEAQSYWGNLLRVERAVWQNRLEEEGDLSFAERNHQFGG